MKRRYGFFALLLALHLLLPACRVATGPRFQPAEACPPEKGLVYVYRPFASRWASPEKDWPFLFADGQKSTSMAIGVYTALYQDPGKHVYEIKAMLLNGLVTGRTLERIELDVEAGKEYYLAFVQNSGGINMESLITLGLAAAAGQQSNAGLLRISRIFGQVPKERALPELQKTRLLRSATETRPDTENADNESASSAPRP